MATYNTGNPLGSVAVKDLFDNAQNLDRAVNSRTSGTWTDRLGVERKTWKGIEDKAAFDIATAVAGAVEEGTTAAKGFRDESEQARDESHVARDAAQEARAGAVAAAGAIGPIKFYDTLAQAQADEARLTEGDIVEISRDEDHGGARTRRKFLAGALLFVTNLDQTQVDLGDPGKGARMVMHRPAGAGTAPLPASEIFDGLRKNVRSYGVKGNGSPEDTVLFDNALLDACANGYSLEVPDGTYTLDGNRRTSEGKVNGSKYIFLAPNGVEIIMSKRAHLNYINKFQGFRFRPVADPVEDTVNTGVVRITGGRVYGKSNVPDLGSSQDPNNWAFVAERYEIFDASSCFVKDLYCAGGITGYYCDHFIAQKNIITNVWANAPARDAFGDGIYSGWNTKYTITDNIIKNDVAPEGADYGRIGVVVEYERSRDGIVARNIIRGYDRAIHVELIKGTATIQDNEISGCLSGVVAWNNYGFPQHIFGNTYTNEGCPLTGKRPSLYTSSPILLLQANTNKGTIIRKNRLRVIPGWAKPANMGAITSDNVLVEDNEYIDDTKTLTLAVSQGNSVTSRTRGVKWLRNKIKVDSISVTDSASFLFDNNEVEANRAQFNVSLSVDPIEVPIQFYRYGDRRVHKHQGVVSNSKFSNAGAKILFRVYGMVRLLDSTVVLPETGSGNRVFQNVQALHSVDAPFNSVAEASGNEFHMDLAGANAYLNLFEATDRRGISTLRPNTVVNTISDADSRTFTGAGNVPAPGGKIAIVSANAPTTGSWLPGDTYTVSVPIAGGYTGGVCVASPNTWKSTGVIAA